MTHRLPAESPRHPRVFETWVEESMRSFAHHNRQLATRYDDWTAALHYAPHTKAYYRMVLGRFNGFLGKRSATAVSHVEIRQFLTHISNYGATLGTAYRYLGVLRRFYDFLNLGGVVSYVAPRLVRMKVVQRTDLPWLTESEVKRLIAATQTKRERALLEFLYSTGCRASEMTHLRVEDIDLEGRSVRVRGKFNKTRIAFLTPSASVALRGYIEIASAVTSFKKTDPDRMEPFRQLTDSGSHAGLTTAVGFLAEDTEREG
jgi:site-specific recombinase XerD